MAMLGEMRLIWDKLTIDLFNYYEQGSSGRQRPRISKSLTARTSTSCGGPIIKSTSNILFDFISLTKPLLKYGIKNYLYIILTYFSNITY